MNIDPLFGLLANFLVYYSTMTRRFSVFWHVLVNLVIFVLMFAGFRLPLDPGPWREVVRYLFSFLFFFPFVVLFKESFAQKVFLFFMSWELTSFIRSTANWLVWSLPGGTLRTIAGFFLLPLIYAVLLPCFFIFWRHRIRTVLALFDRGNRIYCLLPVLGFTLFVLVFGPAVQPGDLSRFLLLLLFQTLLVFMYYVLFSHFHAVVRWQQESDRSLLVERQLALQKKYYASIEDGLRLQGRMMHDYRHHLVAIQRMLGQPDQSNLDGYLSGLLDRTGTSAARRYCAHEVANAVIGGYVGLAQEAGVRVVVDTEIPATLGIDTYDLCSLLGNLIENALEACQRIPRDSVLYPGRGIILKTGLDHESFVVRIENSSMPVLAAPGSQGLSSKGQRVGVGLDSVRELVSRYRGCVSFKYSEPMYTVSAVLYV